MVVEDVDMEEAHGIPVSKKSELQLVHVNFTGSDLDLFLANVADVHNEKFVSH
ncbi:hypothetical protein DY000_02000304 [Brassica cretica]|nr:hypothetical protein DY000_02000304 [Brassica cretica]